MRSPSFHRLSSHKSAKIGGSTTAVYLHENARPPTAALATNARRLPVLRNSQKKNAMPVIVARIGTSIVTSGPCASRFGLSANHHDASTIARGPYSRRLQKATRPNAASQIHRGRIRTSGSNWASYRRGSSIQAPCPGDRASRASGPAGASRT